MFLILISILGIECHYLQSKTRFMNDRVTMGPYLGMFLPADQKEYIEDMQKTRPRRAKKRQNFVSLFFSAGLSYDGNASSGTPSIDIGCRYLGEQCKILQTRYYSEIALVVRVKKEDFWMDFMWSEPCPHYETVFDSIRVWKTIVGEHSNISLAREYTD